MKTILLMLIGFTTLCGDWHPWSEPPEYGELYMYEKEISFMYPYSNKVFIVQPYLTDGAFFHLKECGWYDVTEESLQKLIDSKSIIMYFPGKHLPDLIDESTMS